MSDSITRRALDELADIYLTGPAEPVRVQTAAPSLRLSGEATAETRTPMIEAVLLGHLPGYASPWLSQYAHHAGATHGGAVLVRVHQQVELELFSESTEAPQAGELTQTMETLTAHAGAWLVLIDNPSATEAPRRLAELPRWTLLSGADDAAIVAGYRMLKALLHDCGGKAPINGIGVMFMGCDAEVADDALRRLNRAAAAFLERPIELIGARQRMQPVRRRYIGHYDMPPGRDPWTDVGAVLCELAESGPMDAAATSGLISGGEVVEPLDADDVPAFSAVKLDEIAVPPARVAPRAPQPRPMPLPPTMRAMQQPVAMDVTEALPPPQPAEVTSETAESTTELNEQAVTSKMASGGRTLADHAGLTAIEARCPRHPQVEFALDAAGHLHLMLRHSAGSSIDASLRQLMQARAWAVEHMNLLALACRPATVAPTVTPELHLFTGDIPCALPLADLGVHIHLLRTLTTAAGDIEIHERLT